MISQLFLLSPRGDTLIVKDFRGDLSKSTPETYFRHVQTATTDADPIFNKDGVNYLSIKVSSLYMVATSRFNPCPALVLGFLNNLSKVIKDYIGVFNEAAVRKNFILIYELLDEMMDFGNPQTGKVEEVKPFIVSTVNLVEGVKPAKGSILNLRFDKVDSTATQKSVAGMNNNEVFVDGIERVTAVFNSSGCVITSTVDGSIQVKNYLQGSPIIKLKLTDSITTNPDQTYGIKLENFSLNSCVDDTYFEQNKSLVIRPPIGEFIAVNYKVSEGFQYPFKLYPFLEEISNHKFDFLLRINSTYPDSACASKVTIKFSIPKGASTVKLNLPKDKNIQKTQKAEYNESEKTVTWEVNKFQGVKQHSVVATITMNEEINSYQLRKDIGPIKMTFEVHGWLASGIEIRSLVVENHGLPKPPQRWLRYITNSSSYTCRV